MAIPAEMNPEIRQFQNRIVGQDATAAIAGDRCVSCNGPAVEFKDELSRKEFTISGLCQKCQDDVFTEDEDGLDGWPEDEDVPAF